jgi:hypothetical protein
MKDPSPRAAAPIAILVKIAGPAVSAMIDVIF